MSNVAFDSSVLEVEVYATATAALAGLEGGLRVMLVAEQKRLQAEVDFLREVNEGIGGTGESVSTVAVDLALSGILGALGFG